MHRMDRAGGRRFEADLGPVRACRQQRRHDDRYDGDHGAAQRRGGQWLQARAQPLDDAVAGEPPGQHVAGEHIETQQRHLVAADRQKPAECARGEARAPRCAFQRPREEPQDQRQVREADDLADMLDARARCAAEREGERRHHGAAGMPAAVAEEQDDADPAECQIGEDHRIEGPQADRRIERCEQHVQWREHQRLRIGYLRPAGEHVRRPPRPFAVRDRGREELHLREELRLGIPRDGDVAGEPGPCGQRERGQEDGDRGGE